MSRQPTVFIVDDDAAVRDSLELLLDSVGLAVESFASAHLFLEGYDPIRPGCLLLDIRMPNMDGMELQKILNERKITVPVIFITGHGEVSLSVKALKAGAMDFVEKPFDNEILLKRIQDALRLDKDIRQEASEKAYILKRCSLLTPREKQVMAHLTQGKSNKEIAVILQLSHRTVEVHRARLMDKMQVKSVAELVPLVLKCECTKNLPA